MSRCPIAFTFDDLGTTVTVAGRLNRQPEPLERQPVQTFTGILLRVSYGNGVPGNRFCIVRLAGTPGSIYVPTEDEA